MHLWILTDKNFEIFFKFLFSSHLLLSQRQVAMVSEMIHSASLIHDDVIDQSDFRRGKPSVNMLWSQKKVRFENFMKLLSVRSIDR